MLTQRLSNTTLLFHKQRVGGFFIYLSVARFDLLYPPSFRHPSAILPPSPVRSLMSMLQ